MVLVIRLTLRERDAGLFSSAAVVARFMTLAGCLLNKK